MSKRQNLNQIIARNLAVALDRDVLVTITLLSGTVLHGTITAGSVRGGKLLDVLVHRNGKRAFRVDVNHIKSLVIPNV